uniref:Rab-like protein 1 n=2 Tax=Lygus hesperus TaxID=30085 RepID=A0A0A9VVM8_LYGHE
MFSALKRLAGNKIENGTPSNTSSHQAMSQNLQKKFAKGVQYNMKIIIKGDRSTGKTCLFHRLQGKKFVADYQPTEEIQVASVQWNYKNADDVVKVEVWDVVDKGKKRPNPEGLKLSDEVTPALDAEFIDVYKGTNGVILVLDVTKNWTWGYVQKEIVKVPEDIPVLVLGNHCDMSHHRTIMADAVQYYIDSIQRPQGKAQIRYTEASMSNGFGLKYIHKFFCLPFLQLQKETLLKQLDRNANEMLITIDELDLYQRSPDSDYDLFLDNLSKRRRQVAENTGVSINQSQSCQSLSKPPPSIILGQGTPIDRSASLNEMSQNQSPSKKSPVNNATEEIAAQVVTSVEEFIPDGGYLDKTFLEESSTSLPLKVPENLPADSDSDGEIGDNPLVAGYQDDVDPDDALLDRSSSSKENKTKEEIGDLNQWMSGVSISEGRGSPEGGEDSGCTDSLYVTVNKDSEKKKKSKKKSNKSEASKTDKKKSKRKKSSAENRDLEAFLSSRNDSYEAL